MRTRVVSYPPMPPWVRAAVAVVATLLIAASLGGCSKKNASSFMDPAGAHSALSATLDPNKPAPGGVQHLEGTIGSGTAWVIDKPADWNGGLVVWLQGYQSPQLEPSLPNNGPIRDAILARHYAVIASSYSNTGWNVKEALGESHQLRGVFASHIAQPTRTLLAGCCIGGLVGQLLVEKYPDQYAGALLMGGMEGGARRQIEYLGDVRVLFDLCYPGVLPGTVSSVPAGTDIEAAIANAKTAMDNDALALHVIDYLSRVETEHQTGPELEQTILAALRFQMMSASDLLSRTHGRSFYDNHDYTYAGGLPAALEAWVNANVARYTVAPDAAAYLANFGEPTGVLTRPVVTIHNNWDPLAPESNLDALYACAAEHACCCYLLQHRVMKYGHNNYTVPEVMEAFEDLTAWVDSGVRPNEID